MDLKSGIDKFGLNPEDINDLYDEDKAAAPPGERRGGPRRCPEGGERILFLQRI